MGQSQANWAGWSPWTSLDATEKPDAKKRTCLQRSEALVLSLAEVWLKDQDCVMLEKKHIG